MLAMKNSCILNSIYFRLYENTQKRQQHYLSRNIKLFYHILSSKSSSPLSFKLNNRIQIKSSYSTILIQTRPLSSPAVSLSSSTNLLLPFAYKTGTGNIKNMSRYNASSILKRSTNVFRIDDYDIIGFDLDNTLLCYNLEEMIPLIIQAMGNFLVNEKNYPNELLEPVKREEIDFLQKGLIIDIEKGNLLKIGGKGKILRASHGKKFLTDKELEDCYGENREWDVIKQYVKDPVSTWNGPLSLKIRALLDSFDMSASVIHSRAVDLLLTPRKHNKREPTTPGKIYEDILAAMVHLFSRENFSQGTSEYFENMKKNIAKYCYKTNPEVLNWIRKLKKTKATFLLTGSNIDFANLTASYCLGPEWKSLFDAVICFARKPGFFIDTNRRFYCVENLQETTPIEDVKLLNLNGVYSQGNWYELEELLRRKFKISSPNCLYIGDNLVQDIFAPVKYSNFDTVCIVEEMLQNLEDNEDKAKGIEYENILKSDQWDSYFCVNNEPSYWTEIVTNYSRLCVPSLDFLANETDHEYVCTNVSKFYPKIPVENMFN